MIELHDLVKYYGNHCAVNGIDLMVPIGSFYAFLGPNGAGKSTTIDIICTIHNYDSGEVIVNGWKRTKADEAIRSSIGVVFQHSVLDERLTLRENLCSRARFYHMKKTEIKERINELAQMMEIKDILDQRVSSLSGGERRKGDIARALLHRPKLLILDEPATGLDPKARSQIWTFIHHLKQVYHMTIFMTTHYMEEALYADEISIIKKGNIIAQGTPDSLRSAYALDQLLLYPHVMSTLCERLDQMQIAYTKENGYICITMKNCFEAIGIINKVQMFLHKFEVKGATMDDVFLRLVEGESL